MHIHPMERCKRPELCNQIVLSIHQTRYSLVKCLHIPLDEVLPMFVRHTLSTMDISIQTPVGQLFRHDHGLRVRLQVLHLVSPTLIP